MNRSFYHLLSPLTRRCTHSTLNRCYRAVLRRRPEAQQQAKISLEEEIDDWTENAIGNGASGEMQLNRKQHHIQSFDRKDLFDDEDGPSEIEKIRKFYKGPEKYRLLNKIKKQKKYLLKLNFDHIPVDDQVVLMFPGHGIQHLKMGSKVIDNPSSARIFEEANEVLGFDLLDLCLNGPKTRLDCTYYAHLATFVSSIAALEKMKAEQPDLPDRLTDCAGFSVGELSALVAAEVLPFSDALKMVKVRAEAMQCCQLVPSGMITIRSCAQTDLKKALKEARQYSEEKGEMPICAVASYLYCHVKLLGGNERSLEFIQRNANHFKIQVIKRLPVQGAFHTRLMDAAARKVDECLATLPPLKIPRVNFWSNYTGNVHTRHVPKMAAEIAKQVSHPIKWEQIAQQLFLKRQGNQFPSYFEVGPGRQLGSVLFNIGKKTQKTYVNYPP